MECNSIKGVYKLVDYRNDNPDYNFEGAEFVPACPYCQYMYRQFPPAPPFGGMPPFVGDQDFGPQGAGIPPFGGFQGQGFGPPIGPPPPFAPSKEQALQGAQLSGQPGTLAISPGAIRPCLYRYVYIWLRDGRSFWAWLVFIDRRSAAGWRWTGRSWVYFGVDLRRIDYFVCY